MGKKSAEWAPMLADLEKLVIEGRHHDVKRAIQSHDLNRIPRVAAESLAELAWRISEPLLTLKLLNPFVFPENELAIQPTAREKFIYATALGNLGAVGEAIELFDTIDSAHEPEVNLRKSLAYFRVWNYQTAIGLLKEFLDQKEIAPYRRLIGQVNLAAALIVECRYQEGEALLEEIQQECLKNNYLLLLGNAYEMRAQIEFFRSNFDASITYAEQALMLLKDQGGEFYAFAEKWKLVGHAFKTRDEKATEDLCAFREKALSAAYWETVRDADLFISILNHDGDLARKVILGTPHEGFRHRARRLLGEHIPSQGKFNLMVSPASGVGDAGTFVFSPYEIQAGSESLHSKPQLLALFRALTMDFYRPSHIGLLFQRIYAEEKFNPFTSPQRVLSLMKRLNAWFAAQNVPLTVRLKKSEFCLVAIDRSKGAQGGPSVFVQIHRAQELSKKAGNLSQLRELFKDRTFTSARVAEAMGLSRSSAQQLILQGLQDGVVVKRGTGRGTAYQLASRNRKKAAA